jgi:arsenite-transporting ATPase
VVSAPLASRLLRHLPERFVFVVGKGGVGKTTTAGALALASADDGSRTLLISTDPAHSLGDLFGAAVFPGDALPNDCGRGLLFLEELDGEVYADAWMERAAAPLAELLDRGTYLDEKDVRGFLELTLPGVDELAAVLRLSELAAEPWDRVVVDTAPTGHTLRLLDANQVIRSWTDAFDAMAEKAAAVIGALTRRPVRLDADELSEELLSRAQTFETEVLAAGCAVLVGRPDAVVEAESERLHKGLTDRGLQVRLAVSVGIAGSRIDADAAPLRVDVPLHRDLEGCDGLRRWGEVDPPITRSGATGEVGDASRFLSTLPALLLFVGKGGVGKSTCAAAAALVLSETRDVTLLGADPAGSLADVLGIEVMEGAAQPEPRLEVRQIRAAEEFEELSARYRDSVENAFRALGLERSAALDRRVVESLMGLAPPGIDELFAVSALLDERGAGRTIVLDSAPTGHFLRLIEMPEIALDWTRQLLRVLQKYRAVLGLDAFAERLLDFAKRLKELNLSLSDPERSAAIVVTQPGPLVAAESRRLLDRLATARIRVAAVVANRAMPGSPLPDHPTDSSVLVAPQLSEPPVGIQALRGFVAAWSVRR